jgi:hypothetical protein
VIKKPDIGHFFFEARKNAKNTEQPVRTLYISAQRRERF